MKPSICLCMIVKNESRVIERCLSSVLDLIDHWVISDTGSTDGTQDLIRRTLKGIPGELHEEPWVNFGHNRSLNIRHARGKAGYLLLVDADMVVRRDGTLPRLTADSYLLRHVGEPEYWIKRLVRADIDWRYEGVTHEYLTADSPTTQANLGALAIEHFADGGSRSDKLERDARLLGEDLERDPRNTRTVFYLAQTMRDMGQTARAIELYERRAAMGQWAEEVYYALLQVGLLKDALGDWPGAMDAFSRAWETRPERLEACYEMAVRLRRLGRHRTAHAILNSVLDRPLPEDILFVQPWVYRWGILFEYSISSYWAGHPEISLEACDRLLAMPDLPDAFRAQTLTNRGYALRKTGGAADAVHEPRPARTDTAPTGLAKG
ncbi:glycosyltransferase [Streptomyces cavernae]|uniref:glycosyltransferase n=1 Tax=Streptomyces cavernae TaxID=2259034 RepID=UPI001EE40620|nr:glycosyltransferase [Streptomyces cavernae]